MMCFFLSDKNSISLTWISLTCIYISLVSFFFFFVCDKALEEMGGTCRSDREFHPNHHNLALTDTESDVGDGSYPVKSCHEF
jgi:hypothetical protein